MKVRLNHKVVALAASGPVLLSGATVTSLAAWTDTEWVNGGVSTLPGLANSTFDVQQNVTAGTTTGWTTDLASPGGTVDFGSEAAQLTPGKSVVGYVRLRVPANSTGGTLNLVPADKTLQGLSADPIWQFNAVSD